MKKYLIISGIVLIAISAVQTFAQKDIATFTVAPTVNSFAVDAKGNIAELTTTVNTTIEKAEVVAKNKKGVEYAKVELLEAVGASTIHVMGLYKKFLIMDIDGKYFAYKISKKGAQKIGELTTTGSEYLNIFGNKVVLQTQTGTTYPYTLKFEEYKWDLTKKKKTIEGEGEWPQTLDYKKGTAAFNTTAGDGTRTVKIVSP